MLLLLRLDAVDVGGRMRSVEDSSLLVEEFVEVVGSFLKVEVLDGCGGESTNVLRNLLEHELAKDVVECD